MGIKILAPDAGLPAKLDLGKGEPPLALSAADKPNAAVYNTGLLDALTGSGAKTHVDIDTSRPADPGLASPKSVPGQALGPGSMSPIASAPMQTVAGERAVIGLPIIGVMPSSPPNQSGK